MILWLVLMSKMDWQGMNLSSHPNNQEKKKKPREQWFLRHRSSGSKEWQALRRRGNKSGDPVVAPAGCLRGDFSQTGRASPAEPGWFWTEKRGRVSWGQAAGLAGTGCQREESWTKRGRSETCRGPLWVLTELRVRAGVGGNTRERFIWGD